MNRNDPLLKELNILYVEDEEQTREYFVNFLKSKVKNIFVASNGKEGLGLFKTNDIDIVLTDIRMPIMNGINMAEEIKKINKNTPIVVITAFGDSDFLMDAINIGIDKYIMKPVYFDKLIDTIFGIAENLNYKKEIEYKNNKLNEKIAEIGNITKSMGEGLLVVDNNYKIIYINNMVTQISKYSTDELLNQDLNILCDNYSNILYKIENVFKTKELTKIEKEYIVSKTGKQIPISLSISPLKSDTEDKIVIIFQDITDALLKQNRIKELLLQEKYLKSILQTVTNVNQAIIESTNLEDLLKRSCKKLEDHEYYKLVFITLQDTNGYVNYTKTMLINQDMQNEFLNELTFHPSIESIEKNSIVIFDDFNKKECSKMLLDSIEENNLRFAITLPLKKDTQSPPVGSITIFTVRLDGFENEEIKILQELCINLGFAIHAYKQKEMLEKIESEKIKNYEETILVFVDMIEQRDTYTAGHSHRVSLYSELIARELGFSEEQIIKLKQAAILHDIGKIQTPDSVLLKPGSLSDLEYTLIKQHALIGYEMLSKMDVYKDLAEIMKYHHERFDGKGYPLGLKGDEIPPISRILIVADAFDAMTTNRIYKPRKTVESALEEIAKNRCTQFHPEVVDATLKALKNIEIDTKVSQVPVSMLEKERLAYFYKDQLTDLYNKSYLEITLKDLDKTKASCYAIYLKNFTKYNIENGWEGGNTVLKEFSKYLLREYQNSFVFRIHGDDFIIIDENRDLMLNETNMKQESILKDLYVDIHVVKKDLKSVNKVLDLENSLE
ncbi:MAG: response regulator [Campylobacterales bacterium]|nr:response regulator [Campylobacterales bacterium]